jgi:PqqD family protein of HPr-rel-A system
LDASGVASAARIRSAANDARFLRRAWSDDRAVVYDALSGDTHLLEAIALELLDLLGDGARDPAALLLDLEQALDAGSAGEAREAAQNCLDDLVELGLVVAAAD